MKLLKHSFFLIMTLVFTVVVQAKEQLDLSGYWKFSIAEKHATDQSWLKPGYDCSGWQRFKVPGNWETENEYAHFSGTGYYITHFRIPGDWQGSYIRLCFGAVYQKKKVWLNGTYLGEHFGGYTPFEFEVTDIVRPGKTNILALSVNDRYNRGAWWKWGGISQQVYLCRENKLRIVRQQIIASPDLKTGDSQIDAELVIQNYSNQPVNGVLKAKFFDRYGKTSFGKRVKKKFVIMGKKQKSVRIRFQLNATETRLWNPDTPHLYRLQSRLYEKKKLLAKARDRFGIRKIETRNARLLLNGKPIKINGLNRIATHRAYGQTEPDHLVKFDIDAMKAMGVGLTRIAHHAQTPFLLDYCDEVGMLLIEEIPVWSKTDPQVKPNNPVTRRWLTEMIQRDFNHPCIIGWSVGNELAEKKLKGRQMSWNVYEYVRTMIEYVGKLDPTRLKTYVSNTATQANGPGIDPNDVCDILCHNSYGGAPDQVRKLHAIWPDKPIFVSELGKGQPGEYLDDARLADQLKQEIKALQKYDYVVGCSIWSYNDYRSHFGGTPLSENRAWGMYNVWRQPKKAAYEIRELFTGKKSDSPLPALAEIPKQRPKGKVYIEALVPMKNSCMVGFTVIDKKDSYEISYHQSGKKEQVIKLQGLRGAAKITDLQPGAYTFRIRQVTANTPGNWSPEHTVTIK